MRIRLCAPPRIGSPCKNSELFIFAGVAESADALDSGSSECKFMRVQVPSPAPKRKVARSVAFLFVLFSFLYVFFHFSLKIATFPEKS